LGFVSLTAKKGFKRFEKFIEWNLNSPIAVNFNDSPSHRRRVLASSEVLPYELSSAHLHPDGFASRVALTINTKGGFKI
jgi:hypothetical protein